MGAGASRTRRLAGIGFNRPAGQGGSSGQFVMSGEAARGHRRTLVQRPGHVTGKLTTGPIKWGRVSQAAAHQTTRLEGAEAVVNLRHNASLVQTAIGCSQSTIADTHVQVEDRGHQLALRTLGSCRSMTRYSATAARLPDASRPAQILSMPTFHYGTTVAGSGGSYTVPRHKVVACIARFLRTHV